MQEDTRLNATSAVWSLRRALKVTQSIERAILDESTNKSPNSTTSAVRLLEQMSRLEELGTLLEHALDESEAMQVDLEAFRDIAIQDAYTGGVIPFPKALHDGREDGGGSGKKPKPKRAA